MRGDAVGVFLNFAHREPVFFAFADEDVEADGFCAARFFESVSDET